MLSIIKKTPVKLFWIVAFLLAIFLFSCQEKKANTKQEHYLENPESKKHKFDEGLPQQPKSKNGTSYPVSTRHRKGKISCGDATLKKIVFIQNKMLNFF